MKIAFTLLASLVLSCFTHIRAEESPRQPAAQLIVRQISYAGTLSGNEARFTVQLEAESIGKGQSRIALFEGDVAVLPPEKLSSQLKLIREGNCYYLVAEHDGKYRCQFELVAKVQHNEPWNSVSFTGPPAAISSVAAQAAGGAMEVQLLSGTLLESSSGDDLSRVKGFLGPDRRVALRWQSKVAEVTRKALLTVDATVSAQVTPTVLKYTTHLKYDIVQGNVPKLTLSIPENQTLTRLVGEQIRDWQLVEQPSDLSAGTRQILTIEFIKPVENICELTLFTEQAIETTPHTAPVQPPRPLDVERESGLITLSAEDTLVEIGSISGLRQVNAGDSALTAYRFTARPFRLALGVSRIEPVIRSADRVHARLEETRLLVSHALSLNVEKAGIYQITLMPQDGFLVADVKGEGIEDWNTSEDGLQISFSARVLGRRQIQVELEQPLREFPGQIVVRPVRVIGAERESADIGAAAAPGIRMKTEELVGLREIAVRSLRGAIVSSSSLPVQSIQQQTDPGAVPRFNELLAFTADQRDWQLTLACERLPARIVTDVFNLITVGDGIVGGSATLRYGLINQGVQQFKVQLPPHCRNVEFTGPNIRRKEQAGDVWTVELQDKAWGGYTLVVTYDFQFDPDGATLPIGGIHPVEVERETGTLAVTTAASLQLNATSSGEFIRRVDESELSPNDRALITRAVVLAWQYAGRDHEIALEAKRFPEVPVLEAVADRTQLTSVLTEAGQLLTQASFMVKNNEKQFQGFELPAGADLWACYVNGQTAKPERDGIRVLVPLPRDANRDQTFAVDIVYAEKKAALTSRWSQAFSLAAPKTDVPNTYAEWELYVPESKRMSAFGGSMNVAQGTTYGVFDAWQKFLAFYLVVLREIGSAIVVIGGLVLLVIVLVASAARRGWGGVITALGVLCILTVLAGMLLPALSKAKAKAQRISSVNNLKQVGLAARIFADDNDDRLPVSFDEMMTELGSERVTIDPATGAPFVYLGGGMNLSELSPQSVLAYSPIIEGGCNVLFADGSVSQLSAAAFGELSQRGLVQILGAEQIVRQRQTAAVMGAQFETPGPLPANIDPFSAVTTAPAEAAFSSGARSIRIELPRTGKPFVFTKVLNVHDEPLSVSAKMMPLQTFQWMQMLAQLTGFFVGLVLWLMQWRRSRRSSFLLTVALSLMLAAVTSLLVAWRALHDLLIIGFPVVLLALIAYLVWRFWPRHRAAPQEEDAGLVKPEGGLPPVTATIALLLTLSLSNTSASESEISNFKSQISGASIVSAEYTGTVNDRVAQLAVKLQISADQPGRRIIVFGEEVAVQEFRARRGDVELVRDGNSVAVQLGRRREATVELLLLVKVGGDVTRRHLTFGVPAALSSHVALTLDQPEADIDFPTAVSFQRMPQQEQTRVEAVMGAASQIELRWTPRVKRAAEVAATVFCRNTALVSFGSGVMNVRSVLDHQVTQGELRRLRVRLPEGQRLLRVEGESIRTWETRPEAEGAVLLVELLRGISPACRLTVETEQALESLPASATVRLPHALDVKRETGLIALRGAEELGLSVEAADDLQRVDAEEFNRAGTHETGELASVFRFLRTSFELRARVELVRPQIEAIARNSVRVGDDLVRLSAVIDYTIKRAGVFSMKLALPENYRLEQVQGDKVLQWVERTDGDARLLEVTLKERTSGAWQLRLELSRNHRALPETLAIPGVHPLDTDKLTSFVAVRAEPGVAVRTATFDGLTEIPATESGINPGLDSGAHSGTLAFKHIAASQTTGREWHLAVTTEAVHAWVRAEIVNVISVSETLIYGRALVRYDVANAPVKELRLRIPSEFRNVDVSGPNIRRRDQEDDLWKIELQSKVQGFHTFTVTWDQPRPNSTNALALAGIGAAGVERETGQLVIAARPPLQVTEDAAQNLQKIDTRDLPDWAGPPDAAAVLAYRYVRPGYRLAVNARRFQDADVLQALVDDVRLTSVVAEDGQMMTRMTLAVRNNGRQFLEVQLPPGGRVWSAFVGGQPVRPSLREHRLLLPLEQTAGDDAPVKIELTYAGTNDFPRKHGRLAFESPQLDVPLKNAQWEFYLPPDHQYDNFGGSMNREVAAAPSLLSSFSMTEYVKREKAGKDAAAAEMKQYVSKAQRKLSSGNVRDAVSDLNRARGNAWNADAAGEDVKELEKQVRMAQASNLIDAQNMFVFNNAGVPAQQSAPQQVRYDNVSAEQQWTKLQQAQEVVTARVEPLRVNLPVRGLRYSFTQVLQTETNKSLTVEMTARDTRTGGLVRKAGFGLVGFLALWGIVAVVTGRKDR